MGAWPQPLRARRRRFLQTMTRSRPLDGRSGGVTSVTPIAALQRLAREAWWVAMCLLLYSFAVAVIVPGLLVRLTRSGATAWPAIVAWPTATTSVLASWLVAAGFLVTAVANNRDQPERIVSARFATMRHVALGGSGLLLQATLFTLTTAATGALAMLGWRLARSVRRAQALSYRHAADARIIGRRVAGLDGVVVDAPERAAYSVAGRPETIVATSVAVDALDECHLDAVLAHERAHLTGRHHLMLA